MSDFHKNMHLFQNLIYRFTAIPSIKISTDLSEEKTGNPIKKKSRRDKQALHKPGIQMDYKQGKATQPF